MDTAKGNKSQIPETKSQKIVTTDCTDVTDEFAGERLRLLDDQASRGFESGPTLCAKEFGVPPFRPSQPLRRSRLGDFYSRATA